MGLFTKSNPTPTTPVVPANYNGMSDEAKKLAAQKGGVGNLIPPAPKPITADAAAMIAAPPRMPMGGQNAVPLTERQQYFQQLKVRLHQQLVERLDVQNLRTLPAETVRSEVRVLIRELCQSEKSLINSADQERLMDEVMDETFGLGPLETLLKDMSISDILVNKFDRIYVEKKGRLELSDVRFRDNAHLRQIIDRIVGLIGRRIDETSPMVESRMVDGSRVNAIIPPLAMDGPEMSIRRFDAQPMHLEAILRLHGFTPAYYDFN